MRGTRLAIVCFVVMFAAAERTWAAPVLIVQTPGPPFDTSGFLPDTTFGRLARVQVSGSNIDINQIGVYGDAASDFNMKWLIFTGGTGASPLLETSPVAFSSAGGARWFDSPVLSTPFTLLANQTYWIGTTVDAPSRSYFDFYNSPGTTISTGGLTLVANDNGNVVNSFADPILTTSGGVQASVRLFGPATVPEPTSFTAMLSLGALGLLRAFRRRQHKETRIKC